MPRRTDDKVRLFFLVLFAVLTFIGFPATRLTPDVTIARFPPWWPWPITGPACLAGFSTGVGGHGRQHP